MLIINSIINCDSDDGGDGDNGGGDGGRVDGSGRHGGNAGSDGDGVGGVGDADNNNVMAMKPSLGQFGSTQNRFLTLAP